MALLAGTALTGLALALPALAADPIWDGSSGSNWFDPANWDTGSLPTAADVAYIAGSGAANMPVIDGAAAVADVVNLGFAASAPSSTLTIQNAGILNSVFGFIGGSAGSMGTVSVTGSGSTWGNVNDLFVGTSGNGTLEISDGGAVSNDSGVIGLNVASVGSVSVTGAGSSWSNANPLFVGFFGTGSLTISDGGTVNSTTGLIGFNAGSMGSVSVTGAGSSWSNASTLFVGDEGTGSLIIENGGAVSSADGVIGNMATGTGSVSVTGAGSLWDSGAALFVGNDGTGSLTISDGGTVTNGFGTIGFNAGSTGTVTVDGSGSSWTNTSEIYVGDEGNGNLIISDGGMVSNTQGRIGNAGTGSGTVTVTGPGSLWDNSSSLRVAVDGTGSLSILDGGAVTNTFAVIGDGNSSSGTVTVDGAGSTWTTSGNVVVGGNGAGQLTISNGGFVNVDAGTAIVHIALQAGSTGKLNIGASIGDAPAAAGTLDAAVVNFDAGTGSLIFNHTDDAYTFAPDITGPGFILHAAGTTSYTGDGSGFTGTTDITGGTLRVNNILGGAVNVTGGALGGTGMLTGALTIGAGGTIAPGNSIGTLNVADITFNAGSTYEVEVNSAGQSDLINATGTATINGGTVQVLPFPDFALGSAYTIVTAAGGVAGTFDSSSFGNNSLFITPTLTYDANSVFVSLAQTADFASVGMTPNQIAAAGGAQSLGSSDPVFTAIAVLGDAGEARTAFDALSGEIHASAKTALIEDSRFPREAALNRIRDAFAGVGAAHTPVLAYGEDGPELVPPDTDRFAVWGHGFGSWGQWESDGNAAQLDRTIGGLFLGGDLPLGDWRVGALAGYSNTNLDIDARASSASVESWHLGLYGGTEWGNVAFRTAAAYSWHDISSARTAAFSGFADSLTGDYGAGTGQLFGELAYHMDLGTYRLEPFANLAYVHQNRSGFTEQGGAAALSASSASTNTAFTTLGLRGAAEFDARASKISVHATLGWRHTFGDATPTSTHTFAGGAPFTIAGASIARDAAVIEAGLDLRFNPQASFGLSYSGQLASNTQSHGFTARLGVSF